MICLHFFNGEGYDKIFVENLSDILKRTGTEPIEVFSGADDVCLKCPHLAGNICRYSEDAEEDINEMDKAALSLLGVHNGGKVRWEGVREKIPGVFPLWLKTYCRECDWMTVCRKNLFFQKINN